ncbi:SDR family NAD(P)-dependent oxidoreductase [Marinobacterium sedimentorum]|uniref:SDR family NAD(P)-dependent oxidoreductase n=1 Tax=Marinobacterium sedimentorum TaxID=2927804 RepID=UPI0020C5FC76|nr:SDR family NAD(P)-dependent oxidoreductase [Marinobacterium sedimentorum]MCP8686155.1 SDR family NAD(P)-dependent oxidoreductase [Marinobacterium sedimentorum]
MATALVVGATRGIGQGFVRALLQRDWNVYASYRDFAGAGTLSALTAAFPGQLHLLQLDLADESSIVAATGILQQHLDEPLALVLCCAGLLHEGERLPEKSLSQLSGDWLQRSMTVNALGPLLLLKHLHPLLVQHGASQFAVISARVGSISENQLGGWYSYRASKAALNMLMKTAAIEMTRRFPHLQLLCLHPGTTSTDLSQPFSKRVAPEKLFTVERSVRQLLKVLDDARNGPSGRFLSWDGSEVPW